MNASWMSEHLLPLAAVSTSKSYQLAVGVAMVVVGAGLLRATRWRQSHLLGRVTRPQWLASKTYRTLVYVGGPIVLICFGLLVLVGTFFNQ